MRQVWRLAALNRQEWMKELLRTNDIVLLSYLEHRLSEAGLAFFLIDAHMSVMEGSIGVLPRRILVTTEDMEAAQAILAEVRLEQQRDGSNEHPAA